MNIDQVNSVQRTESNQLLLTWLLLDSFLADEGV